MTMKRMIIIIKINTTALSLPLLSPPDPSPPLTVIPRLSLYKSVVRLNIGKSLSCLKCLVGSLSTAVILTRVKCLELCVFKT